MASGMKKTGNWGQVNKIVNHLSGDINKGTQVALKQVGLKAESIAVKHIKNQDLEWEDLDEDYKERKGKKGLSTKTLVSTSDYMNSITSNSDGKTAFAGVKKDVKSKDGTEIISIAAVHEFGTDNIPKRELWKPTFEETLQWVIDKKVFQTEVLKKINKRK
jgi:phage gpG-like protein